MPKGKYIFIGLLIVIVTVGVVLFSKKENTNKEENRVLTPTNSITHPHGLAVDIQDINKLYIATHHGLLVLDGEKDLFRVGQETNDYMGFSAHPIYPKVFFTSGHSSFGNLGFQKSEDGGFTWNKISNGLEGPVDFHAMSVSPANFNLIYGWFRGALQRSEDEGKNWEKFPTDFPVVNLAADPKDENVLFAASPQGLFVSKNKGETWDRLLDGFVSVATINPQDSQKLLSFSEKNKLAKSNDAGQTWEKLNETFNGETPLFISFSRQNSETVYTLTEKNSVYKSNDSGNSWAKVR